MKLFGGNIATETIDHQYNNDIFKNELITAIQSILDKIDSDIYRNRIEASSGCLEHMKIKDIIFKRTGIFIKFLSLGDPGASDFYNNAAVNPCRVNIFSTLQHLDMKNVILQYFTKKDIDAINNYMQPKIDALSKDQGTVDAKTGRLGGVYSKIENDCYIDFYGLYKNSRMTAGEIAAILMHEVGHVFTWTQFSNKLSMVNQTLQHIYNHRATTDSDKLFKLAYSKLKDIDRDITETEVKSMISGNTISATYNNYLFLLKNLDLNNLLLDLNASNVNTNSETIADIYSVRMGFGLEFINAMDKMNKSFAKKIFYVSSALCVILISIFAIAALLPSVSIMGVYSLLFMYVVSGMTMIECNIYKEQGGLIYKYDKERMQKVYNQLVDSVKDLSLKGEDKQRNLESLKTIKTLLDALPSDISTLDRISHILSSKARVARAYSVQQDILEKIANNDLFVKAVELELTSKGKM